MIEKKNGGSNDDDDNNDAKEDRKEETQCSRVFPDLRAKNPDQGNSTALHAASHRGHIGIVQYLLDRKADIEAQNSLGYTPLFEPILQNRLEAAQLLIKSKANVEAVGSLSSGATPLIWACFNDRLAMVKLFVEKGGARLDAKDFYGKTPRAWSEEKGFTDIQSYLIAKEQEQNLNTGSLIQRVTAGELIPRQIRELLIEKRMGRALAIWRKLFALDPSKRPSARDVEMELRRCLLKLKIRGNVQMPTSTDPESMAAIREETRQIYNKLVSVEKEYAAAIH
eukprot:jgi/Bigna1/52353/estExt_Genewise1Plus.C_70122